MKGSLSQKKNLIAEIASNDGYLLQYFKEKNIPVIGIDPAETAARIAINKRDINTEMLFFGVDTAKHLKKLYGVQAYPRIFFNHRLHKTIIKSLLNR